MVTFLVQPIVTLGSTVSPLVPVVSPASFNIASNPPFNTLVGVLTVSNLPLSAMNIASGDPSHFFAVTSSNQNLRTAPAGPVPPDGSYSLGITATNAGGTGPRGTVTVAVGGVTAVNLSGTNLGNLGAQNKGAVIGHITVTGTQTTPVVLGGTNANLFSITNGGIVPCDLIAAVDIPAGSYSISLTAT